MAKENLASLLAVPIAIFVAVLAFAVFSAYRDNLQKQASESDPLKSQAPQSELAGGTEFIIRIGKSNEEVKIERFTGKLADINMAIRAANGDEKARKQIDTLLEGLRAGFKELTKQIAQLAGNEAVKAKRRMLESQRDAVMERINDLSGKNNEEMEGIQAELATLKESEVGIDELLDILRKRITAVTDTQIRLDVEGDESIRLQIPPLEKKRVDSVRNIIGSRGILEFRLVKTGFAEEGKEIRGYEIMPGKDSGELLYVENKAYVSSLDIAKAEPSERHKGWQVSLTFTGEGRRKFAVLTGEHVNERLAIVLDGELLLAPTILCSITDGEAVITGNFTRERATEIVAMIEAGFLPVKLTIISENRIQAPHSEDPKENEK